MLGPRPLASKGPSRQVTAEVGLLLAVNAAREQYETAMEADCGEKVPSVPAADLQELHTRELSAARATFIGTKKMGAKEDAELRLRKLTEDINKRLPEYMSMNRDKTQRAIIEANEAYEKVILSISGGGPLCLHPNDLKKVHDEAVTAALKVFDAKRKRSLSKDEERTAFIEKITRIFDQLQTINDNRIEYERQEREREERDRRERAERERREHMHRLYEPPQWYAIFAAIKWLTTLGAMLDERYYGPSTRIVFQS
ncbi:Uncharacterized protein OBRU01_04053 [Operophtera brumata]|uniref:Uncharacterized protein n=1 Tax=Operophtera brumata TaxID=104452 RepID=A0A0L7L663_OPEBR|nr:Uncharacterized protein OBRU01_04053 [Operophtera brumata]